MSLSELQLVASSVAPQKQLLSAKLNKENQDGKQSIKGLKTNS